MTMPSFTPRGLALVAALGTALALAACGRADEGRTVGQQVDAAIAQTERTAERARQEAREAASEIRQEGRSVTSEVGSKVADAAITAAVNADLAQDSDLSALRIDVDTADSRVTLKGSAPTPAARERASRLAANVKGVSSVDNQLAVQR